MINKFDGVQGRTMLKVMSQLHPRKYYPFHSYLTYNLKLRREFWTVPSAYEVFVDEAKQSSPDVYNKYLRGRVLNLMFHYLNYCDQIHHVSSKTEVLTPRLRFPDARSSAYRYIRHIHLYLFVDWLEKNVLPCEICANKPDSETDNHKWYIDHLDIVACKKCSSIALTLDLTLLGHQGDVAFPARFKLLWQLRLLEIKIANEKERLRQERYNKRWLTKQRKECS